MLKKLLIAFVLFVGGFCVYVAMKPSDYRIERTAVMKAAPQDVFSQVNDLRKFNEWSPWAELDPNAKADFGGAPAGEGASFTWSGNDEVGKGTMTVIESSPHERIRMRLDFKAPMEDSATAEFLFEPEGSGTRVTWAIFGEDNFIVKLICTFMDRDAMVGDMFNKGLSNLKKVVERS